MTRNIASLIHPSSERTLRLPGSLQGPLSFMVLTLHPVPIQAVAPLCFTGSSSGSPDQMRKMAGNEKPNSSESRVRKVTLEQLVPWEGAPPHGHLVSAPVFSFRGLSDNFGIAGTRLCQKPCLTEWVGRSPDTVQTPDWQEALCLSCLALTQDHIFHMPTWKQVSPLRW